MTLIYWLTAAASLAGVWLNIRKRSEGFLLWMVSSAVWTYADATHGLLPQALIQATYFVLSIYGFIQWRHHGHEAPR